MSNVYCSNFNLILNLLEKAPNFNPPSVFKKLIIRINEHLFEFGSAAVAARSEYAASASSVQGHWGADAAEKEEKWELVRHKLFSEQTALEAEEN